MLKRLTAIIIALVMCLSLLSATSFAEPEEGHEHNYTAKWKYFLDPNDPETAGYYNSGNVSWNPAVSHGRTAMCVCGATNPDNNIWVQEHFFDDTGTCQMCGFRTSHTAKAAYVVPLGYSAPASQSVIGPKGTAYRFVSPQVEGLRPTRDEITGEIGSADETFTVEYEEIISTVTVHYQVPEGYATPLSNEITERYGTEYSFTSPTIDGLTPDQSTVSGEIGEEDETIIVQYTEGEHTVSVYYIVPEGYDAPASQYKTGPRGTEYQFDSPPIQGLTPDKSAIQGKIGTKDETFAVSYSEQVYTVTVNYVVPEGTEQPGSRSETGVPGTPYSIDSPEIFSMTPDQGEILGHIGSKDETFTVTYTPNEYTVTVVYHVPEGYAAPASKTAEGKIGTKYSFTSPTVAGLSLLRKDEEITGTIGAENQTINVFYWEVRPSVTVIYNVPEGYRTPRPMVQTNLPGVEFEFPIPDIDGLQPDRTELKVTNGMEDQTVHVNYSRIEYHTVTVNYIDGYGGREIYAPSIRQGVKRGESITIASPRTSNRQPDRESITVTVENADVTETVTYSPVQTNTEWSDTSGCLHPEDMIRDIDPRWDGYHVHSITHECRQCRATRNEYHIPCSDGDGNGFCDFCSQNLGQEDPTPVLTVNYVVPDGYTAPASVSKDKATGSRYFFESPGIEGLMPDRAIVEGTIGSQNETITVTYEEAHRLTIHYVLPAGYPLSASYTDVRLIGKGKQYQVSSPAFSDVATNTQLVSGVMGDADIEATVEYDYNTAAAVTHRLTVNYTVPAGFEAPQSSVGWYASGAIYEITPPHVDRLAPSRDPVSGTMGDGDLTLTVPYYKTDIHRVTVIYTVPEPYINQRPQRVTLDVREGEEWHVISPKVEGLEARRSAVYGRMGDHDIEETVEYWPAAAFIDTEWDFSLQYIVPAGYTAPAMRFGKAPDGWVYDYDSPKIEGLMPDRENVYGVLHSNTHINVTYKKLHTLTVNFVYPEDYTGTKLETLIKQYREGEAYWIYSSEWFTDQITYDLSGSAVHDYRIAGTMGTEDLTATVTFSWRTRNLTVDFTFPEDYEGEKPQTHTEAKRIGVKYEYPVPRPDHLRPSMDPVEGNMGFSDVRETVNYDWIPHTINFSYTYPEGYAGPQASMTSAACGETRAYRYRPEELKGLIAVPGIVEGTMGNEDITVAIEYKYGHKLTVHFEFPANYTGARLPTHTEDVETGAKYEYRPPEKWNGLLPAPKIVEGTMGDEDVEATVVYSKCDHEGTGRRYESENDTTHRVICTSCDEELEKENHQMEAGNDAEKHFNICSKCKAKFEEEAHTFFYAPFQHVHDKVCEHCDYQEQNLQHTFVRISETDGVVTEKCVCGQTRNVYPVLEGKDQTVNQPEDGARFRINADHEKFNQEIKCDDRPLRYNVEAYSTSGSTIITLAESYLSTLSPGVHTLTVGFTDGITTMNFTTTYQPTGGPAVVSGGNIGATGSEVSWTLFDDGLLLISGTGATKDYYSFNAPFKDMAGIQSVIVGSGVTGIGNYLFSGCAELTDAVIPDSVRSIGSYAFNNCTVLENIQLSDGVRSIGNSAFYQCEALESIDLPNSVLSIGTYAFYKCSALQSLTIPEGVTAISDSICGYCTALSSLSLPSMAETIGTGAFYQCSSLTGTLTLPARLTSIGARAFYQCGIDGLVVPAGVISIGENAFGFCQQMAALSFPDGLSGDCVIGQSAFYSCKGLTAVTLPEGVISIGKGAFQYCSNLTEVKLPASLLFIDSNAFYGIGNANMRLLGPYTAVSTDAHSVLFKGTIYCIQGSTVETWAIKKGYTTRYIDPETGLETDREVQTDYRQLRLPLREQREITATFPDQQSRQVVWASYQPNIVSVETSQTDSTVVVLTGLAVGTGHVTFTRPNSYVVTDIAVEVYDPLTAFRLPAATNAIEESAFEGNTAIEGIYVPDACASVGRNAFKNCTGLTQIRLPKNCEIDSTAFSGCGKVYVLAPEGGTTQSFCGEYDNLIFVAEVTQE